MRAETKACCLRVNCLLTSSTHGHRDHIGREEGGAQQHHPLIAGERQGGDDAVDHLPARLTTAGLEAGDVARDNVHAPAGVRLADAASGAEAFELERERGRGSGFHETMTSAQIGSCTRTNVFQSGSHPTSGRQWNTFSRGPITTHRLPAANAAPNSTWRPPLLAVDRGGSLNTRHVSAAIRSSQSSTANRWRSS